MKHAQFHYRAVPIGDLHLGLACELRPSRQHGQKAFEYTLERIIPRARTLTDAPLLLRADSAHGAEANRRRCRREPSIDFMNACAFFEKAVYTS